MNLRSTSGPDIESTSVGKGARSSSSSAAERRNGKAKTSPTRKSAGRTSKFAFDKQGKPLTISYDEVVADRVKRDPKFATAMLRESINALLAGELGVGKHILRNYVNGTLGFDRLAKRTGLPIKSLMRMLSHSGNPRMNNFVMIIRALKEHAGIEFHFVVE